MHANTHTDTHRHLDRPAVLTAFLSISIREEKKLLCFPIVLQIPLHTHTYARTHTSHSRQDIFITTIGFLSVPFQNSSRHIGKLDLTSFSAALEQQKSVSYTLEAAMREKYLFQAVNKKEGSDKKKKKRSLLFVTSVVVWSSISLLRLWT